MAANHESLENALSRLYQTPPPAESFETGWRGAVRREEAVQMEKKSILPTLKKIFVRGVVPVAVAIALLVGAEYAGWNPSTSKSLTQRTQTYTAAANDSAPASVYSDYSSYSGGVGVSSKSSAPAYYAMEESADVLYDSAYGSNEASANSGTELTNQETRKLVRTADLTIRTKEFEQDMGKLQTVLAEQGGYIADLSQSGESVGSRRATLSMRVPSGKLDDFLGGIGSIGRVTSRNENTTDMTVQYADNEARLNTLRTKQERLLALLAKADKVEDLIELESAIADTQYTIDSYESTQRSIDRRVDMSTVTVKLIEERPSDSIVTTERTLGERIAAAFEVSIEWLCDFANNALVFLVMILPLLGIGGILWLVIHLIRKNAKKRRG